MTANIQYVKMPASESMSQFVSKKLQKLAEKYDWIITADVFFKQENDPAGTGKICEIALNTPGPNLFAASKEKNFGLAAKRTVNELEKQLKKRKALMKSH